MTTSSARPDALDHAADGFRTSGNRLHQAARAVWAAVDAYADRCPAVPVDLASPSRAGATVADGRDLGTDLRHMAAAFRGADTDPAPGSGHGATTITTDVALSATIVIHHPSLGRELTGPTRALEVRGARLAESIVDAAWTSGAHSALALLHDVPGELLADPTFAAAVVNGIGSDRLMSITEALAFTEVDWTSRFGPLADLARLWTTATRSTDLPPRASRLDHEVVDVLLASARGRNTLRALTGGSGEPAGERYLRQVVLPLLTTGARRDEALSNTYRFLRGRDRQGDPDAPMLDAVSRVRELRMEAFLRSSGPADLEARTTALLDADVDSQPAVVALLDQALAHERLSPDTNSRGRAAVLRATYSWVLANGPDRVTEPLAQMLADTLATDIDFYLGRADVGRRAELALFLQAVTEFERPWMTAILAFEHHGVRLVQETLHGTVDGRVGALSGLRRLEDGFEEAAAASDRPVDRASGFFAALSFVADTAVGGLKLHPVVSIVANPVTQEAIDVWHERTIEDPGDHEARTRQAREGLRRRIWVVIASDRELGSLVDWSVGGDGPDRHQHLGSRITSIDDLVALSPDDAGLDELTGWASAQPDDLRALVDAYLSGA